MSTNGSVLEIPAGKLFPGIYLIRISVFFPTSNLSASINLNITIGNINRLIVVATAMIQEMDPWLMAVVGKHFNEKPSWLSLELPIRNVTVNFTDVAFSACVLNIVDVRFYGKNLTSLGQYHCASIDLGRVPPGWHKGFIWAGVGAFTYKSSAFDFFGGCQPVLKVEGGKDQVEGAYDKEVSIRADIERCNMSVTEYQWLITSAGRGK